MIKVAVADGAHPLGLTFWFAALSAVMTGGAAALRGRFKQLNRGMIRFCLLWSLLGTVIPGVLFFYAAREIPAGIIALAIAMVPILTYLGALATRQDEATLGRIAGILLGAIAGAILILPEATLPKPEDSFWVLMTFLAAFCFAIEHLYFASRAPKDAPLDLMLCVMFSGAALVLLPMIWVSGLWATGSFVVPSWPPTATDLVVLGVAAVTTADYFFFALLIAWAGPVFTSQAAYIVTLSGVLWGIVLFGENHSLGIWAALALLMIGIFLVRPRSG